MGTPAALGLATLSGVLCATTFPPLSWSMAAWLALVPLLVACAALSPLRAAIAGMCWTATMAVGVGWFLPAMLSHYFGLATVPSWLASVAIVLGLHGIYVSSFTAWVAWLVRRRAANPLLLAGGWLVCEFARAHGMVGSPWALTAYSQIHVTPLIQIADLAGPYGIGMLVAGVNACVAALLVPAFRGRRPLRAQMAAHDRLRRDHRPHRLRDPQSRVPAPRPDPARGLRPAAGRGPREHELSPRAWSVQ